VKEPAYPGARRLSRNVIVLSWVSFFQDTASEMLYPVLPLFLTDVLGAGPAAVGLIEGMAEGLSSILKGFSGKLADRIARRPLVAAGYGLSSIAKGLIAAAASWPFVLLCRVADRMGKGLRTAPRDALIASDTAPDQVGRAFGFHRAIDTAGAVVGPLLGLSFFELLQHRLRPLFVVAVIPALVSTGLIALVREQQRSANPTAPEDNKPEGLSSRYWHAIIILTIFGLVNFPDALIILHIKQLGFGYASIMLAYTAYNATYAALSYPAGTVADRQSKPRVFATGTAVFAIVYIGFGIVKGAVWVWVLIILYGGYAALTDAVGKAWISSLVPDRRMGAAMGYYQAATGTASIAAGVWAGLLWGTTGTIPFVISGVVAGCIAILLTRF